jgi:WD40 repeat protein
MKRQLTLRILMALMATLLLMTSSIAAQNVSPAELQFREALHKQQVEGDLNGAIKLYQNIIDLKTTDRVVKAKALLQLATVYETLGKESQNLYEQIARDFSDQPAAVLARAKIAALRSPAPASTVTMRKVEFGPGLENVVATDGQRAVYWDATRTSLFIGDAGGKNKRVVFTTRPDRNLGAAPEVYASRDLSILFFHYTRSRRSEPGYAVIKTDGTGYHDIEIEYQGTGQPQTYLGCASWSWDNRYLLLCKPLLRDGLFHLLKVSVADGQAIDMLENHKVSVGDAAFSPDDRYIAYTEERGNEPGAAYVFPAQGGEPRFIAEKVVRVDWTRDGRYVIAAAPEGAGPVVQSSSRLSVVPIQNGRPSGERVPISASVNGIPHTWANGSTIVKKGGLPGADVVFTASTSVEGHLEPWKALELVDMSPGNFPDWSPNGRQIVYSTRTLANGVMTSVVRVRNVPGGEDREVYRSSGNIPSCVWARRQPVLFCGELNGSLAQTDIRSIALDSGRVDKAGTLEGVRIPMGTFQEDRVLRTFGLVGSTRIGGSDWEIGTDRETSLGPATSQSDDGRWSFLLPVSREGFYQIAIREISNSDSATKILAQTRMQPPGLLLPAAFRFSPDSKWIVYHDKSADGKDGLYRVSVSGGEPLRLGDYPISGTNGFLSISPDGRQFIATAPGPERPREYWFVENLVPPPAGSAKPAPKAQAK